MSPLLRLFLVGSPLLLLGCAGETPLVRAQGRVVYQGQPVTGAVVIFQSSDSAAAVLAPLRDDGTFEVVTHDRKGLPPGTYRVAVKPAVPWDGTPPLAGMAKEPPAPRQGPAIPAKFHGVETSNLTVHLSVGKSEPIELDLTR